MYFLNPLDLKQSIINDICFETSLLSFLCILYRCNVYQAFFAYVALLPFLFVFMILFIFDGK